MSDNGGDMAETTDFSKLKVNDLKKILKNRGLPMTGSKQELVERLQSAEAPSEDLLDGSDGEDVLEDGDLEKELDESCLMGDDAVMEEKDKQGKTDSPEKEEKVEEKEVDVSPSPTNATEAVNTPEDKTTNGTTKSEEPEPANITQQKRKICLKSDSAVAPEIDKKKLRAERFGAGDVGLKTDVLVKRAERFPAANSTTTNTTSLDKTKQPQTEALKKRAERFGILTPAELRKKHLEKLQARKLRFGTGGVLATTPKVVTTTVEPTAAPVTLPLGVKLSQLSAEERKNLRANRFKMN